MIAKNIFIAWNPGKKSWVANYDLYHDGELIEAALQYEERMPKGAADKKELIQILKTELGIFGFEIDSENAKVIRHRGITPSKTADERKPKGMITAVTLIFLDRETPPFVGRYMTQDNGVALKRAINERWEDYGYPLVFFVKENPQPEDANEDRIYGRVFTIKEYKGKKTKGMMKRKDCSGRLRVEFR